MHRLRIAVIAMAIVLAGGPPASGQPLTGQEREAIERELTAFMRSVEAAMRSANADQILDLYGRPDVFVNIEDGRIVPYDRMAAAVRDFTARVNDIEVRWVGTPRFVVLNRDAAVLYGFHHFAGAGEHPAHTGVWTGVLQRIDGRWKIVHAHGSDAAEPG